MWDGHFGLCVARKFGKNRTGKSACATEKL